MMNGWLPHPTPECTMMQCWETRTTSLYLRWEVGSLSSCFLCLRDPIWSSTYISSPQTPSMSQILSKTKHRKSIFAPLLKQNNIEEFAGSLSWCTKPFCHWWGSPVHGGCRKCHIAFGGSLSKGTAANTTLLLGGGSPAHGGCSRHHTAIGWGSLLSTGAAPNIFAELEAIHCVCEEDTPCLSSLSRCGNPG